jgi:hypothetical protein
MPSGRDDLLAAHGDLLARWFLASADEERRGIGHDLDEMESAHPWLSPPR